MILVVNTGSSSLKFTLFDLDFNIIQSESYNNIGQKLKKYSRSTNLLLSEIKNQRENIEKVGYRVVHGGDEADEVMAVTLKTMNIIEKFAYLAPHHNPQAKIVIKLLIEAIPFAQHFAVFDTAFFKDLPPESKIYPIDKNITEELDIKRFGFHGISHEWALNQVDALHKKKVITVHLGAGSSLAAIDKGKPIDTSMGFTPIEGVPMQTRSGDIDPEIAFLLSEKYGIKVAKKIIEENSGLAGLSGTSGNMLTLLTVAGEKVEDKNFHISLDVSAKNTTKEDAQLALNIFCYRLKKYIGAYIAALGGLDILAFTGEIGYHSTVIREKILSGIDFCKFDVKVIKPDEELAIAKKLLSNP